MSFLRRIAARAAPVSRAAPMLMPKDAGLRRAAAPAEEMPDEEDEAQRAVVRRVPLRRAEPEEKDETLERQEAEQEEDPATRRAAKPPDEEPEEEPPARSLARATEEEDDNLRPARPLTSDDMSPENARLPDEVAGEPEPPDLRALRRASAPPEDDKEPEAARAPADMAEDEDEANMRPLRRAMGPIPTSAAAGAAAAPGVVVGEAAPPAPAGDIEPPAFNAMTFDGRNPPVEDFAVPSAAPAPAPASFARPQVIIDQLDVVIHEPAPAPARTARFRRRPRASRPLSPEAVSDGRPGLEPLRRGAGHRRFPRYRLRRGRGDHRRHAAARGGAGQGRRQALPQPLRLSRCAVRLPCCGYRGRAVFHPDQRASDAVPRRRRRPGHCRRRPPHPRPRHPGPRRAGR